MIVNVDVDIVLNIVVVVFVIVIVAPVFFLLLYGPRKLGYPLERVIETKIF